MSFSSRSRAAVASKGRMRSAVPWTTSVGHVDLGQVATEVGQPRVDARIGGKRSCAGRDLEARLQGGLADAVREDVDVVEVVEEGVEVGVAIGDDRAT